jgi:type II secretion system protein H
MGRRQQVARGFTLLELIVTLAVLALAVAVVTPAIGRSTEGLRARAEVATFAAMLRHAREQAISTQRTYRVSVDSEGRRVSIVTLPGSSGPAATPPLAAREHEVNETRTLSPRLHVEPVQVSEVVFDVRGGTSGGDIKLTSGSVVYRVTVDRLTGRVKSARE